MVVVEEKNPLSLVGKVDVLCIPTSGTVRRDGTAVMESLVLQEASLRWRNLPKILGSLITSGGNRVHFLLCDSGTCVISFPVKPDFVEKPREQDILPYFRNRFSKLTIVPGFALYAVPEVVKKSSHYLRKVADLSLFRSLIIIMPESETEQERRQKLLEAMREYLDNRFTVCFPVVEKNRYQNRTVRLNSLLIESKRTFA